MAVDIAQFKPSQHGEWDSYVEAHPQATFFHMSPWRRAVETGFGHRDCSLIAYRDGRLSGVFPMMCVDSALAGRMLVSVPYGVYGGTLADDDEMHQVLFDAAIELARELRAKWIDIRSQQRRWTQIPANEKYVVFRKDLPASKAEVLASLPRKARAAARHARDRYQLESSFDADGLRDVWSLYSQSMRRIASLNYPFRFFEALVEQTSTTSDTPDCCSHVIQRVMYQGRPIAGLLSFVFRDCFMPYFAGCDEQYAKYHPNNFMYLAAMEKGVELGCRQFDFGRTRRDNEGAFNFKRFQGFEPEPLGYQYAVVCGDRVPDLTPSNPRFQWSRRVWPKLPMAVTRPLGAWLAKSVPG
jgi:FemAB-related protein (PEP-CTERM system-associated)